VPTYTLNIVVEGKDRGASSVLKGVHGGLGSIGTVVGGIVGAQLFFKLADGVSSFVRASIGATAQMQQMRMGIESLLAREYLQQNRQENLIDLAINRIGLEKDEASQLMALRVRYDNLTQSINAAAEGSAYQTRLMGIQNQVAKDMNVIMGAGDLAWANAARGVMTAGEAFEKAQAAAIPFQAELEKIAILSPYRMQDVMTNFRQAMAFGFPAEEAKVFTAALLDVAAGTGASSEMLNRMAYNLSQVRLQGRVTAIDVRQLALAGFDLTGVLRFMGEKFGVAIEDHNDFNAALKAGKFTWQDFTESFKEYADTNFAGASERMSKSLFGLTSTFQDAFMLTMPKILGPAAEVITGFLGDILDEFLKLKESGILEEWGRRLGDFAKSFIERLGWIRDALTTGNLPKLFRAIGFSPETVFSIMKVVTWIQDNLIPALQTFGTWVSTNWPTISQFLTGFAIALGVLLVIGAVVGAVLAIINAPIILIAGAIALLYVAWMQNWGGIRDFLLGVWAAIQPTLQTVWTWLATNIPLAVQTLANFWSTVLLPAIMQVWTFLQTSVIPLFMSIANLIGTVLNLALTAAAGLWQNVLLPAIMAVVNFLRPILGPVFGALADLWENRIAPALSPVAGMIGAITGAFTRLGPWIQKAIKWIDELVKKIEKLKLPKWLTPGSPTPLELGLRGITDSLKDTDRVMDRMGKTLSSRDMGFASAPSRSSNVTYDQRKSLSVAQMNIRSNKPTEVRDEIVSFFEGR